MQNQTQTPTPDAESESDAEVDPDSDADTVAESESDSNADHAGPLTDSGPGCVGLQRWDKTASDDDASNRLGSLLDETTERASWRGSLGESAGSYPDERVWVPNPQTKSASMAASSGGASVNMKMARSSSMCCREVVPMSGTAPSWVSAR